MVRLSDDQQKAEGFPPFLSFFLRFNADYLLKVGLFFIMQVSEFTEIPEPKM